MGRAPCGTLGQKNGRGIGTNTHARDAFSSFPDAPKNREDDRALVLILTREMRFLLFPVPIMITCKQMRENRAPVLILARGMRFLLFLVPKE